MRSLLAAVVLMSASPLLAAAPAPAPGSLRAPVEVSVIGLKAKIEDGRVLVSWRRYKRGDFKSYHLLKSTDASPSYPETASLYSTDYSDKIGFEDAKLAPGTWHYRLCIVTRYGDRWVSPVITVVVGPGDVRHDPPTEADFE
jgi:hypothetical protein